MDALSEILKTLRLESGLISRAILSRPWAVAARDAPFAMFHAVVSGECWLVVSGLEPIHLAAGDLAILPQGHAHVLEDQLGRTPRSVADLPHVHDGCIVDKLVFGGGGARTDVLCGRFQLHHPRAHEALVRLLPPALHLTSAEAPLARWLDANLALMADELPADDPGSDILVTRVTDVLVLRALRAYAAKSPAFSGGWIAALRDPKIAEAIAIMHTEPGSDWTAGAIARRLGMSRTVFHERFRALVGETPVRYLARWRMGTASDLLHRHPELSIIQIAERVGYRSEDAFTRAFRRLYGVSPSAYRRAAS